MAAANACGVRLLGGRSAGATRWTCAVRNSRRPRDGPRAIRQSSPSYRERRWRPPRPSPRPRAWAPCTSRSATSTARSATTAGSRPRAHPARAGVLGAGDTELLDLVEEPGRHAGRTLRGPLPACACRRANLARWLAHACARARPAGGDVGPLRQRGDASPTPTNTGSRSTTTGRARSGAGRYASGCKPLDVGSLLQELDDQPGRPSTAFGEDGHGARASAGRGRPESIGFYRDVLGFALAADADGLGRIPRRGRLPPPRRRDVWHSRGAPPAPAGTAGLLPRPSSFPTPMSATGSPRGSPAPDRSRKPARTACLSATRRDRPAPRRCFVRLLALLAVALAGAAGCSSGGDDGDAGSSSVAQSTGTLPRQLARGLP